MADKAIPNFTQIPNNTLDTLFLRTPADNLVMIFIARKTYGWHKERDRISLSQIVTGTGLSRRGVINSIKSLIKSGWIGSDSDKQGNKFYWLFEKTASELNALSLVNSVHPPQSTECTPPVNSVHPQNKLSKETKQNISLNKGQIERDSEPFTSDKQTKIEIPKEVDTLQKRKISPVETILNGSTSKDSQESAELARIGLNSISLFSEIAGQIAKEKFNKKISMDAQSLTALGTLLDGDGDRFRKLCLFFLSDDFYGKTGFTYKNILSCYDNRNNWETAEPVKQTAYNTRDYKSPVVKAEIANIVKANEDRMNGIVPEQPKRKTIREHLIEREALKKLEALKNAV